MKFIARERETERLLSAYHSNQYELILIYGRRHVGKTKLIQYSAEKSGIKTIYYMCRQISEQKMTEELSDVIASVFSLDGQTFRSFEDAIRFLYRQGQKEPLILILDEYPNAREEVRGLDTLIQALSDEYKDHTSLNVVLSGSYLDVMKTLKSEKEPLFGRITLNIDLKPMDYYDASRFYSSFSDTEKVELYSVFGGIPLYNSLIREDMSVKDNIIHLIASADARLADEVNLILMAELTKIRNANSIFDALAEGEINYSLIQKKAGIESTGVMNDAIKKLIGIEVLRKEFPINKEHDRTKSHYYIDDQLILFYYTYISRNLSKLQIMNENAFFDKFIKPDFNELFVPRTFEKICRQYLIRKNLEGVIDPVIEKIGKYYYDNTVNHTNGEFDIVTQDENGFIFYEAKYKNRPLTEGLIQKEIQQVQNTTLHSYRYGFFSKSGFADNVSDEIIRYSLSDLYQ